MASYNKFNNFTLDLLQGCHDFAGDTHAPTYKVMLTNTAPVATNHLYGDISATEVANGFGYTTGGTAVAMGVAYVSGTTAQVTPPSDTTFTASGGSVGPFRYAVLYNATTTTPENKPLVAWWDYGSSVTLADGETFTVDFDQINGIFTIA